MMELSILQKVVESVVGYGFSEIVKRIHNQFNGRISDRELLELILKEISLYEGRISNLENRIRKVEEILNHSRQPSQTQISQFSKKPLPKPKKSLSSSERFLVFVVGYWTFLFLSFMCIADLQEKGHIIVGSNINGIVTMAFIILLTIGVVLTIREMFSIVIGLHFITF